MAEIDIKATDYSLYLVTDSTDAILRGRNLASVVQDAVRGGATIVQLRDKTSSTAELISIAEELHHYTQAAGVPLLINDRVDVALAAGVEGVHIGQDDMSAQRARQILGPDSIIGVTVNTPAQAINAALDGADYLGIGTVFATSTKADATTVIGVSGVRQILATLVERKLDVKTVCIGGINERNVQRVMYQSATPEKQLNGVAVVSAIIGSEQPESAAKNLLNLIRTPPPFAPSTTTIRTKLTREDIVQAAPKISARLAEQKPLCHNMTNTVVQNFAANICIAIGSSPIMSNNSSEASDLAKANGCLVINMGTTTPQMSDDHVKAIQAYNTVGVPILLDPVGAGATKARKENLVRLMNAGYFDVIKGNESEITAAEGSSQSLQKGVDSAASTSTLDDKIALVKKLAARERNVVIMTGKTDIVSDGERTCIIKNGHPFLGEITGSGCTLGATIASFVAVERQDKLLAVVSAVLMFEIAAERASSSLSVRGPGSFIPSFIDELYLIREESSKGSISWAEAAQVELI